MKTVVETKVFKNGGSSAIRIPASIKLEPGSVVYIEVNNDVEDIVIHRHKPTRLSKFFAMQKQRGPISDEDWNFVRNQSASTMRDSIKELIEEN